MAKLTNKQYREARIEAENVAEVFAFERYEGGFYTTRFMSTEDIKEMRNEYKNINGFKLEECNNRAIVIPVEDGYILQSYYTKVASIRNGEFFKLWNGYSNTTLKHINAFRHYFGMVALSKREWIELETV